jgi:hypothetical protein
MKYLTLALLCFAHTLVGAVHLHRPLRAQGDSPLPSALPPFYAGQLPANSRVTPPVVVAQFTEPAQSARPVDAQVYDGLPRPSADRPTDSTEIRREQPSNARAGDQVGRRKQPEIHKEQGPIPQKQEDEKSKDKEPKKEGSKQIKDAHANQHAEEDALLEHIRALDRLLESSTVQRIMNLMSENMELKAQMRIREAEFKMQLEMMEQRLNQSRDSERRADEAQRDSLRPRENPTPPAVPSERDRQTQLNELQRRMEQIHKNHQQRTQELLEQNQELRLELSRREKAAREANKDAQAARVKEETKKKLDAATNSQN